MADPATAYFAATAVTIIAGLVAKKLLQPEAETPLKDESLPTLSTRGSYIPLLIGERRISPFIAWTGNRTKEEEPPAGGKGVNSGGSTGQLVYYEDGLHVLAVGPGYQLTAIKINGKNAKFNEGVPITFDGIYSGFTFTTKDGDSFQIFWGNETGNDQNILFQEDLAASLGIDTKWYRLVMVYWKKKRLGGFPTWPSIQYDLQVRPHVTAVDTSLWTVPSWMENGPGPNGSPHRIWGINNSSKVGDATDFPYVKVYNKGADSRSFYPPGGFVEIRDQPYLLANRLYSIAGSTYEALEVYNSLNDDDWVVADTGDIAGDDIRNDWNYPGSKVTVNKDNNKAYPSNFGPSDGWIYTVINNTPKTFYGVWIASTTDMPDGAIEFRLWIQGLSNINDNVTSVKMGIVKVDGTLNDGAIVYITNDGNNNYSISTSWDDAWGGNKYSIYNLTVEDAGNNYLYVSFQHRIDDADIPFNSGGPENYQLVIQAYHNTNTEAKVRVFIRDDTVPVSEIYCVRLNPGQSLQGITTVEFAEPLLDLEPDIGEIEGYSENSPKGATGPNPAYTLAQLLFEPFPYGRGLSTELWDLDSLATVAETCDAEGLRLHVLATEGKTVQEAVQAVLADAYIYIAWDPNKGKYVFGSLREPVDILTLPLEALAREYAEQETIIDPDVPSLVTFDFTDRNLGYRKNTQPVYDDANSYLRGRRIETVSLETPTDIFAARNIAARRRDEITVPTNKYKFTGKGEARKLVPGQYIKVAGFPAVGAEEVLTVVGVDISTDSPEVGIEAVTNILSLVGEETLGPLNSPDDGGPPPGDPIISGDLYQTIWEVPPFLSRNEVSVVLLRIAANANSVSADILASTDNNEFSYIGSGNAAIGGILAGTLPANTLRVITDDPPIINPVGGRPITDVQSLTDEQWQRGRNLVYINGEVFYLRKVTPTGAGGYYLDGLIRARLGTRRVPHPAGSVVYIFKESDIRTLTDLSFGAGREIYIKAQPPGLSLQYSISSTRTMSGTGVRPLPVQGIRTANLSNHYRTGEDIPFTWLFYDPPAFRGRYGSGFQRAGETKEETTEPVGYFRLTFRDGSTVLRTIETRKNSHTYTNAELVADTGGPEPSTVSVDIEMIQNGYRSAPTTLSVVKL